METKVRVVAREIINGLKNADNTQNLITWLNAAKCLTAAADEKETKLPSALQHFSDVPLHQLQTLFRERHFGAVCSTILDLLSVEWVQKLPGSCFAEHVHVLFLTGPAADALLALDHAVQTHRQGFKLHKTTTLLEAFIDKGRLLEVVWDQCQVPSSAEGHCPHASVSGHAGLWEELVRTLVSLPSRMANCLGRENSDVFLPQNYVPRLARCVLECLQRAHDLIADSKDCSLEFVSRLVGKLCFTGSADLLLDVLVPLLCSLVTKDYIWCRVCERVITGVPPLSMESVIVPLLTKIPWYGWVGKFLGDCVVHNQKVRFLLCTKLLFHRYFSQVLLLQNLLGYLVSSHTRRHLYTEVFCQLLRVWGDASTLRHVSSEQHLFLCRALIICISHVGQQEEKRWREELIGLLLPGVQSHLGSTDVAVRSRGMLVAQLLTKTVDPTGQQIEFEIPRTAETEELEGLLVVPPDPGLEQVNQAVENLELSDSQDVQKESEQPVDDNAEELDSDDDLVPYDMSFDTKMSKVKAPKYIRDCMEGLLSTEEVDKFEASLGAAESLIRSRPDGIAEIAAEFTKILLHTTETCGIPEFLSQRFNAMVALAVQCPKEVAQYLTSQFYERNYNVRQRLDILEVLAAAAQELSQPDNPKARTADKRVQPQMDVCPRSTHPETWREVVQRRIESKTRRFGKGRSGPEPVATANRFGSVAGEFFYPLMTFYDKRERFFDLLGDDSMVLHRLVYTLAIILHATVHTTAARQMGRILLEFTWSLRLHRDVKVRQAVLVATSVILLVLPSHCLLTDLQVDMMETKAWLESVAEKEVNVECKKLAVQGLSLLESVIAKEMQSAVADTGASAINSLSPLTSA